MKNTQEKVLRAIVISSLFLVTLVPLMMIGSMFFPFITGKNFFFRLCVEIGFGSWIILMLRNPDYRPRFSWLAASVLSFIGLITLSDIFGQNPYKSFWSNFERMEGLVTLLHLGAFFVVAGNTLKEEKLWRNFFNTSIGVSLVVSLVGFMQLAGAVGINQSANRLDANFGNATYLAIYMLFHVFLTAFIALRYAKGGNKKMWYSIAAVVMIVQTFILYHTETRGALLGLIGGAGIAAVLMAIFEKRNAYFRKSAIGVLIALVVIVGGFILIRKSTFVANSSVLSRFASISLAEITTQSRFMIWNMAYQGFKERPLLGWGQENFNYVFNKYYDPRMYAQEQWFDRTHNVVLDWLIAGGVLGLLSYLSMFVLVLYYIWKQDGEIMGVTQKSVLTGMLGGYFIHNLFVFDNVTSYILFFSILAYVYARNARFVKSIATYKPSNDAVNMVYLPTVAVLFLIIFYNVIFVPYRQNVTLIQSLSPQQVGGVSQNLVLFKKVFAYGAFGSPEAREQLLQISGQIASVTNGTVDPAVKTAFAELSRVEIEKQLAQTPDDARYHLFYGSYLNRAGQYAASVPHIEKASELSPKKQSIMFELSSAYINNKQYTKALDLLKKAYELDTTYTDARVNYALSAVYAGRLDLTRQIMEGFVITEGDDRLINIYVVLQDYKKVLELWKLKVAAKPEDYQAHVSLAAVYLKVGDRKEAIAEIEKAIELNPDFKKDGDYYVKEIKAGRNPST